MGGPYNIPRDYKGEDKILMIFSRKAFAYTGIGVFVGAMIRSLFQSLNCTIVGNVILVVLALAGFIIGTFKIPEASKFEVTRKLGGEKIDDVIVRYIKFKKKHKRIYVYKEEERNDGQ